LFSVDYFVESLKLGVQFVPPLIAEALSPCAELLFPMEVGDFSSYCCSTLMLRSSIMNSFARFVMISDEAAILVSPIYAGQLPFALSSKGFVRRSL